MNLVFFDNSRLVTDSLTVAETFGKSHFHVLRDIEDLECSEGFRESNFGLSSYRSSQNKELPKQLITQDGFSFLVMGYTGKEAARFKEMYIGEFNRMRNELNKPQITLPRNFVEALEALVTSEKEKLALQDINAQQEQQMLLQRPLVIFAESLQVSKDSILIGELAKLLKQNGIDVGATRLFEILRQEGYLIKSGSQRNLPTQRSMNLGIMEIKIGSRSSTSEGSKATHTTKITGKGQIYFVNKFKNKLAKAQ